MSLGNDRFQCSEPTKTFRCCHTDLEEDVTSLSTKSRMGIRKVFHMEHARRLESALQVFHVEHRPSISQSMVFQRGTLLRRNVPRGTLRVQQEVESHSKVLVDNCVHWYHISFRLPSFS